jgi:hypothetical protein
MISKGEIACNESFIEYILCHDILYKTFRQDMPPPDRFFDQVEFVCDSYTGAPSPDISQNCVYKNEMANMNRNEGHQLDMSELYTRSWIQTMNLVIGVCVLGSGIYFCSK